jgi:hypothetical protein
MRARAAQISLLAASLVAGGAPARGDRVSDYVSLALQGDLQSAHELFEVEPAELTREEAELAGRFRTRFVLRNEPFPDPEVPTTPFVRGVIAAYRTYWTKALMGEVSGEDAEGFLAGSLRPLLADRGVTEKIPDGEVLDRVRTEIERDGLHALGGMTRPHFELMLWAYQDSTHYEVELTDTVQPSTVVFIGDFLVRGWSHFATFGRASTGGWATKEVLYCLRDDYDLESEKFQISYLKHESRHFADYLRFPALEQIDLEYRGKLTELAYARSSLFKLLEHFAASGKRNRNAPHSFANHAVVRDLSRVLLGEETIEVGRFQSLEGARINQAARELLAAHTERLVSAGADTIRGVID